MRVPKRNEDVAVARHHHAIAVRLQISAQTLRDVERHHLFAHALPGHAAAIMATVAGIDHDRLRLARAPAWRMSARAMRGKSEKAKTQRRGERYLFIVGSSRRSGGEFRGGTLGRLRGGRFKHAASHRDGAIIRRGGDADVSLFP